MKKIILTAMSVAFISLAGCAGTDSGPSYKELLAQAKTEMAKAKKVDHLWRDTGKLVKKAKAARADSNTPKAKKLLKKAITQAKLAQVQAKDQAGAKPAY
ncbi:MAG TPA: hypothetical protein ENI80_02020 [Acidiferrobacteraceae bacterium]|nr:hypothetical protein [Acidiferrobacteraceae bacterium]